MKYTKKQRDEAILICAIAASNPELSRISYRDVSPLLGIEPESDSTDLAIEAHLAVGPLGLGQADYVDADIEAAQLLRDGWSPGDPVEVRK